MHDMRSYRQDVNFNSLNAFHHKREWRVRAAAGALVAIISPVPGVTQGLWRPYDCIGQEGRHESSGISVYSCSDHHHLRRFYAELLKENDVDL